MGLGGGGQEWVGGFEGKGYTPGAKAAEQFPLIFSLMLVSRWVDGCLLS